MSNLDKMKLRINSRILKIEDFNKEMKHNFLVIQNFSFTYTGEDYGPPDPPPGRETFEYMSIFGFETLQQVREYLEDETKNSPAKISNYKVIHVGQYLEPKSSVTISV